MQSAFVFHGVIFSVLPMSSCSNGASSFHNNGMEGEVVGTKPSGCVRKKNPIVLVLVLAL